MAQAKHIGKVVVTSPSSPHGSPGATAVFRPRRMPDTRVRADASYLITGGLGALGLLVAERLVARGARHVALLGRRAPSDEARARIAQLEAAGAEVRVLAGDVGVA